jgi:hypothetical protein
MQRAGICLCGELQLSDPHFKFSRHSERGRNGTPQSGFPRLRFAVGKATGIAIRPDHNSAVGGK